MRRFFRQATDAPNAQDLLHRIVTSTPRSTSLAPKDSRGIYGLIDHLGELRYIGCTRSADETFHKRIHLRHRTGSEDYSHYFSRMYNSGRMWRLRNDPATKADGGIAKKLRNAFIAEYCKAVWVPIPDEVDIARLEQEVIALAPKEAVAWNGRSMAAYNEPIELVDRVIRKLNFGAADLAALERQKKRYIERQNKHDSGTIERLDSLPPFPSGPFRFVALDVETANGDRGSICQIGVACVRPDNSIETWVTFINPQTHQWSNTPIHGITASKVAGSPTFEQVLPHLKKGIGNLTVYQHSGFDRSAIRAACAAVGHHEPAWDWCDSVVVARRVWPELKGNGGHGLASLKIHLGLSFHHHDAGEDARAAAEIVLRAESTAPVISPHFEEEDELPKTTIRVDLKTKMPEKEPVDRTSGAVLGYTTLTQGNLNNNHFYLRDVLTCFPDDSVGGPNAASSARNVTVEWGGHSSEVTDIDGKKKLFRKRGWVGEFFKLNRAKAGDQVKIELIGTRRYRVSIVST